MLKTHVSYQHHHNYSCFLYLFIYYSCRERMCHPRERERMCHPREREDVHPHERERERRCATPERERMCHPREREDVPPPRERGCATPERERMCHPREREDVPPPRERGCATPEREREVTCHYIRSLFQQQHNTKNRQALNINDSVDVEKGKKKCVTYNTCLITINIAYATCIITA